MESRNRVDDPDYWKTMKSCLQAGQYCSDYQKLYAKDDVNKFNTEKLTPVQSGCCKPSNNCNFTYKSPTVWNKTVNSNYTNPDCRAWNNDPNVLCYNCNACKAGMVQHAKTQWKEFSCFCAPLLSFLSFVFTFGWRAFNKRMDDWK